jgi:hypothetical protein
MKTKSNQSPHAIEARIRKRLSRRFHIQLEKKDLEIKDGVTAEFDLVSRRAKTVGQIKTSAPRRKGKLKGQIRKQTQFGDCSRDCLLLAAMKKSKTRLFILTNRTMFNGFRSSPQGKAAELLGVKIVSERI